MSEILLLASVFFVSALIHGLVGFAFALTALPLIAVFKSVKFAVPLLSLFSFTVNLLMLFILKEKRIFKIPLRFFLVIIFGTILGVRGFTLSSEYILRVILFIAITVFFLWELYQLKYHKKIQFVHNIDPEVFKNPKALVIAFMVGFLAGLLNTPGPPIVMYLTLLRFDKNLFKATLQIIFAFSALNAAINHYLAGNLTLELFKIYLICMPVVIVGMLIGQKLYLRMSNRVFYYLVNVFLLISAFLLLIKPHS